MDILVAASGLPVFEVGPAGSTARFFHGEQHNLSTVSLMLGELQPGEGPGWHRHPYDELFVIQEGTARFEIGTEIAESRPGEIVIARAGITHRFMNTGTTVLRVTAVHAAAKVVIEWLDPPTT